MRREWSGSARRAVLAIGVGLLAWSCAPAAEETELSTTDEPLRIGIIGSGNIGGALGRAWAEAGHEILFSSRNPEELADLVRETGPNTRAGLPEEAAAFGDVVLIAVPYVAVPQIGRDFGPLMQDKVVIELGNPRFDRDGEMAYDALERGTGVVSAEFLPGVRLVRAFNAIGFTMVDDPFTEAGERIGVPIAGDDPAAVAVVSRLAQDAGLDPVYVGGLDTARQFDRDTPVYVKGMSAAELRTTLGLPQP